MRIDRTKAVHAVAVVATIALLAVEIVGLRRIWHEVGQTFPGFLVSRELAVEQLNQPYWEGMKAGLRPGDLVVSVDGRTPSTSRELFAYVRGFPEGTPHHYEVVRRSERLEFSVRSDRFEASDFLFVFGVLALTVLVFILVGLVVVWVRPDALGIGVFSFSFVLGLVMAASTPLSSIDALSFVSKITFPILIAGILHFCLSFPVPTRWRGRFWPLAALPYLAMTPLAVANVVGARSSPEMLSWVEWTNRWLTFSAAVFLLARISAAFFSARRGAYAAEDEANLVIRERVQTTFVGTLFAVGSFGVGFVGTEFGWIPTAPASMYLLPAWIWFGSVAFAAARHDVFELGEAARRAIGPAAIYGVSASAYLLVVGAVLLGSEKRGDSVEGPSLVLFVALLAAAAFVALRSAGRRLARQGLVPAGTIRPRTLRDLVAELASSLDEPEVIRRALRMGPRLRFPRVALFLARGTVWEEVGGGLELDADHPVVRELAARGGRELGPLEPRTAAPRVDEAVEALDLACLFPLGTGDSVIGAIGFGPASRAPVVSEDMAVLGTVAGQVAVALENARAYRRIRELEENLRAENVVLKETLSAVGGDEQIVGSSESMAELRKWLEQVGPLDTTVLLRGETGTGKGVVARRLHDLSRRRDKPFIRVNCAAIPSRLLESELFGHEKGSFTGAVSRRLGRFELADGGTLFLDEIGELPLELQPKLLRALQEREFERVGGDRTIRVDVRVIAATNRDLEAAVREGRFREDLYFRLNVVPKELAPLRERRQDIPDLVAHVIRRETQRMRKDVSGIEESSLRALVSYDWPGNVRELENVIERAMVLCRGDTLVVRGFGDASEDEAAVETREDGPVRPLADVVYDVKVRAIRRALERSQGNQKEAASSLGLQPSSLSRMMRDLGLR